MLNRALSVVLAVTLLVSLAACGAKEPSQESSAVPSAPAPESSTPPEETSQPPEQEPDPMVEQHREEMLQAVAETIAAYQNGTIETGVNFPVLPEDFTFPEDLSGAEIHFNEVMGDYSVKLPSATSDWSGSFTCDNTIFVQADGTETGGVFRVTQLTLRDGEGRIPDIPILPPDEQILSLVEMTIQRYQMTDLDPRRNFLPDLPEGFVFPETLDPEKLSMTYDLAEAIYQVVVPSESGGQKAIFRCKRWNGTKAGTCMIDLDSITFE